MLVQSVLHPETTCKRRTATWVTNFEVKFGWILPAWTTIAVDILPACRTYISWLSWVIDKRGWSWQHELHEFIPAISRKDAALQHDWVDLTCNWVLHQLHQHFVLSICTVMHFRVATTNEVSMYCKPCITRCLSCQGLQSPHFAALILHPAFENFKRNLSHLNDNLFCHYSSAQNKPGTSRIAVTV